MKNNEMMKKMENGETVIGMLRHVIIGLWYRSRKCIPSWTSDDEEEYTEVTSDDAERPLTRTRQHYVSTQRTSLCKPTPFHRDRKQISTFIQECKDYLSVNRAIYTTDKAKIAFILSYMNDKEAKK